MCAGTGWTVRHSNTRLIIAKPDSWAFVIGLLVLCFFLQRFGLTFGDQSLNVVGPLGLGLAIAGVIGGRLTFSVARLCLSFAMLAMIMAGSAFDAANPQPFVGASSMGSLLQFVAITGFAVFSFRQPMDERVFFRIVQTFFLVVALAGILQFFAQMAGLRLFSFTGVLPSSLLVENGWNLEIPAGIGDLMKSNGFFLVEPSVLSQFMALAIAIELLYFRRRLHLAAFVLGLLLSFSGTGWLVLIAFALAVALRLGGRGVALAALLAVLLATAAGLTIVLAPDFAAVIQSRFGEISTPGTSGHMRFVTPFWLLGDMMARVPMASLLGIGAGTSEHLTLPYEYDVNTPVKISLEFGFPVFILYIALFVIGRRTERQSVLVLPGLVLLLLTGAYQQFAPIVFLVSLLLCIARLEQAPASRA